MDVSRREFLKMLGVGVAAPVIGRHGIILADTLSAERLIKEAPIIANSKMNIRVYESYNRIGSIPEINGVIDIMGTTIYINEQVSSFENVNVQAEYYSEILSEKTNKLLQIFTPKVYTNPKQIFDAVVARRGYLGSAV